MTELNCVPGTCSRPEGAPMFREGMATAQGGWWAPLSSPRGLCPLVCVTVRLVFILFLMYVCVCSVVSDFATPCTVTSQAPLSMGFPRQEYWSGLRFPSPGDLRDPWKVKEHGHEQRGNMHLLSLLSGQADSLPLCHPGSFVLIILFYLFSFGYIGSSLLHGLFSRCGEQRLLSLWCSGSSL